MYQLNNYFNIRIYIIPIWFYFNGISLTVSISASIFTFQYGSTLIHSCQFRIFFMLIYSFLSTSLYLFYFPIHFIMFFIKKPLIPFVYIPLSTSSHFYFIEHRQNFSLLIYIICKFNSIISHFIISTLHMHANYAQTECQFRYCGTAIPFLTVRSTAR